MKKKIWIVRLAVAGTIRAEVEATTQEKAEKLAMAKKWDDVISYDEDLHPVDVVHSEEV